MDENKEKNVNTELENKDGVDTSATENNDKDTKPNEEVVTMSKADFDKAIQGAEDRIRTHYSKDLKKLQGELESLKPQEKSDKELELDKRIKEVESKQAEAEKREKIANLKSALVDKGLPANFADFVSPDVDIDSFTESFANTLNERMKASGYQPTNHAGNTGVSLEEFIEMDYDAKFKLRQEAPELYNSLNKKTI